MYQGQRVKSRSQEQKAYLVSCSQVVCLQGNLAKYVLLFFTALHEMQTRSSDENSVCLSVRLSVRPSVCPSVRPSVCHARDS